MSDGMTDTAGDYGPKPRVTDVNREIEEGGFTREPSFHNTLQSMKNQLGCDGAKLDEIAGKLLPIIDENPTQAVVALAKFGWVLVAQQELDAEREEWRRKAGDAAGNAAAGVARSRDHQTAGALGIVDAIDTIVSVAHDEKNPFDPPVLESIVPLLRSLRSALQ